jgi:hypothetical protein
MAKDYSRPPAKKSQTGSSRHLASSAAREYSRPPTSHKRPELLAPAANLTAALTAFDCGADAVYVGLKKFNARERGENFGFDDLSKLLYFSRRKNRKVYVTLNTLIKETELPDLVELLGKLAYLRPDFREHCCCSS